MMQILKKTTPFLLALLMPGSVFAQATSSAGSKVISLKPDNWEFKANTAQFVNYKSVASMKIVVSGEPVVLKNLDFTDGTIEYDMEPLDPRFTAFYFRRASADENECFYFRTALAGNKTAVDAVQYAPHVLGINLWDMLYHFQAPADFKNLTWNHVKLVVSGKQMRAYVNSKTAPTLTVTRMEGNVTHGGIAFDGQVIISNLVIKPNEVEGLSPKAGPDPTANDPLYLRKWHVNLPVATGAVDFNDSFIPKSDTKWQPIAAERRGLINLTRKFGKSDTRRIVWLRTKIKSQISQERKLDLGFSDEVWVYVNGKSVYSDKNIYLSNNKKQPDGRLAIQNSSLKLPLVQGENEILIGVANDFYGWGIVAKLDKREGLVFE